MEKFYLESGFKHPVEQLRLIIIEGKSFGYRLHITSMGVHANSRWDTVFYDFSKPIIKEKKKYGIFGGPKISYILYEPEFHMVGWIEEWSLSKEDCKEKVLKAYKAHLNKSKRIEEIKRGEVI